MVAALISALAVLIGALVTAFVGPAWKSRLDSEARGAGRLWTGTAGLSSQSAFDLQSRLYNIARLGFLTEAWGGDDESRRAYA